MHDIVGNEESFFTGSDPSDFIASHGDPPVIAIDMGVSSGTYHEMKTLVPFPAYIRAFRD
jgi:hypothetical protein